MCVRSAPAISPSNPRMPGLEQLPPAAASSWFRPSRALHTASHAPLPDDARACAPPLCTCALGTGRRPSSAFGSASERRRGSRSCSTTRYGAPCTAVACFTPPHPTHSLPAYPDTHTMCHAVLCAVQILAEMDRLELDNAGMAERCGCVGCIPLNGRRAAACSKRLHVELNNWLRFRVSITPPTAYQLLLFPCWL